MQPFFTLDRNKANKVGKSDFISGNTQTVLTIYSASWKELPNNNGVVNYALSLFVANESKSTAHLNIFYGNSNGERWSGENLIHAIMTCLNLPALSKATGRHWEFDSVTRTDVEVQAMIAPELTGKSLGVFLVENWYNDKNTNEPKKGGAELFNVFDPQTQQLAWQKNTQTPPNPDDTQKVLDAMFAMSEKNKKKAFEKANINPNAHPNGYQNDMTNGIPNKFLNDFQDFSNAYQRTPAQPHFAQNVPTGGVIDENIPF